MLFSVFTFLKNENKDHCVNTGFEAKINIIYDDEFQVKHECK